MSKALLLLSCAALAGAARAERFISIPMGTKINTDTVRAEMLRLPSDNLYRAWLGYGINDSIDAEVGLSWVDGNSGTPAFNVGYNYVRPIVDISPGLSAGLLDITNQTVEGRAAYLAITWHFGNDGDLNQNTSTELTLGLWSRDTGLFFVGMSFPFTDQFRFVAEQNSKVLTAGFDWRPIKQASIKLLTQDSKPALSLSWTQKL